MFSSERPGGNSVASSGASHPGRQYRAENKSAERSLVKLIKDVRKVALFHLRGCFVDAVVPDRL